MATFFLARIIRSLVLAGGIFLALALSACGDSEESTPTESAATSSSTSSTSTESTAPATTTTSTSGSCSDVETFEVESSGTHFSREFTAEDYSTNPPTAGDHDGTPIATGKFYESPPPLGESVHALEHGAVIGWTNGLSPEDEKTVQSAFEGEFKGGYYQLAVVENPDLEVPFALSSWDSLQRCESVDAEAISSFVQEHYAPSSTAESELACSGKANRLPACRAGTSP